MSSVRGGTSAARGRGNNHAPGNLTRGGAAGGRGRGSRGRGRGGNVISKPFAAKAAVNNTVTNQNGTSRPANTSRSQVQRQIKSSAGSEEDLADRYARLKREREHERTDAIRRGLLADPEKPRALVDAITPVGTCQDMCAEYERVERAVRNEVWDEEKDQNHSAYMPGEAPMDEPRMVKIFKRSAAGDEEQLPSDLRPPLVLKQTCDYLFNDLIGNAPSLAKVHNFVWNRTRAIRRDFSIQQVSKPEDLRIAIDCYERIARFHILSLHELALASKPYPEHDYKQDREQLDKTLLSLMQYYDDSRNRIALPNEAEFRAYCVVFQLQDFTPDLEDRVQSWPKAVAGDPRVQQALRIYAAACNVSDLKGPLKTSAIQHLRAQQDPRAFFKLVESAGTPFLMACVAEIFFNAIRHQVLNFIVQCAPRLRGTGPNANHFVDLEELMGLLAFDNGDEVINFCDRYGLDVDEHNGRACFNIGSKAASPLSEAPSAATQLKSSLVEDKRWGRTFPAVINGLTVQQAMEQGLVEQSNDEMEDYLEEDDMEDAHAEDISTSLFIPDSTKSEAPSIFGNGSKLPSTTTANPVTSTSPFAFGKPSITSPLPPSTSSPFAAASKADNTQPAEKKSPFSFTSTTTANQETTKSTGFNFLSQPAASKSSFNFLGGKANDTEQAAPPASEGPSIFGGSISKPDTPQSKPGADSAPTSLFQWAPKAAAPTDQPSDTQPSSAAAKELAPKPTSPFQSTLFSTPKPVDPPQSGSFKPFDFKSNPVSSPTESGLSLFSTAPESPSEIATPKTTPTFSITDLKTAPTFGQNAASSTLTGGAQSDSSQPASSLPQQTPPAASASASTNSGAAQNASLSTDEQKLRRSSTGTKPKKPSPLSHSFSASDDNTASTQSPGLAGQVKIPNSNGLPNGRSELFQSSAAQITVKPSPPPPAAFDPDKLLNKIAKELTYDPYRGIIIQFVEFYAGQIITGTQEKVYYERVNKEADDFRHFSLCFKYGKRWRDICRRLRLARQGKERRQRARRRLEGSHAQKEVDAASVTDNASIIESVVSGSVNGRAHATDRQSAVDALFQSTNGGNRFAQAQSGNKRPASSGNNGYASSFAPEHKRVKSNERMLETARRSTLSSIDDPRAVLVKRSAFLGFSLPPDAADRGTTTKSTYFKLKAMGIDPNGDVLRSRGVKRQRSESVMTSRAASPSRIQLSSASQSSPEQDMATNDRFDGSRMLPPPPKVSRIRTNEADEALFARLRAAREGLTDETSFMKSTTSDFQVAHRVPSVRSASDSPSMVLARAEARLRASQPSSQLSSASRSKEVPAYRLRESRFVPREHYSRAVERANEIRSNRSRESSRPTSRLGYSTQDSPVVAAIDRLNSEVLGYPSEDLSLYNAAGSVTKDAHREEEQALDWTDATRMPDVIMDSQTFADPHTNGHVEEVTLHPHAPASFDVRTGSVAPAVSHEDAAVETSADPQYGFDVHPSTSALLDFTTQPAWSFSTTEPATSTHEASTSQSQDVIPETFVQASPPAGASPPAAQDEMIVDQSEQIVDAPVGDAEPQLTDHRVHPEDIPAALSASFGPVDPMLVQPVEQDQPGQVDTPYHQDEPDHKEQPVKRSYEQDLANSFGHRNPFASLQDANGEEEGEDEDDEEPDSDQEEEDDGSEMAEGDYQTANNRNVYFHRRRLNSGPESEEYDEEESGNEEGDDDQIEDQGSEGDDEDGYDELEGDYGDDYDDDDDDGEEGEEDDEEHHYSRQDSYGKARFLPSASPNPALQIVGGTVEEAIELSD